MRGEISVSKFTANVLERCGLPCGECESHLDHLEVIDGEILVILARISWLVDFLEVHCVPCLSILANPHTPVKGWEDTRDNSRCMHDCAVYPTDLSTMHTHHPITVITYIMYGWVHDGAGGSPEKCHLQPQCVSTEIAPLCRNLWYAVTSLSGMLTNQFISIILNDRLILLVQRVRYGIVPRISIIVKQNFTTKVNDMNTHANLSDTVGLDEPSAMRRERVVAGVEISVIVDLHRCVSVDISPIVLDAWELVVVQLKRFHAGILTDPPCLSTHLAEKIISIHGIDRDARDKYNERMNSPKHNFSDAVSSIEENGSYAIATTIVSSIKDTITNLRRDVKSAVDSGNGDQCYRIVVNGTNEISEKMATMMTALNMVDVATIRLLNDIEMIVNDLDKPNKN